MRKLTVFLLLFFMAGSMLAQEENSKDYHERRILENNQKDSLVYHNWNDTITFIGKGRMVFIDLNADNHFAYIYDEDYNYLGKTYVDKGILKRQFKERRIWKACRQALEKALLFE